MTKRQAMRVLIRHAAENCAGAGCGVRPMLTVSERSAVSAAICRLWKDAYGHDVSESVFLNLNLPVPQELLP